MAVRVFLINVLSGFLVEGSRIYKILAEDQRLAVYQELLTLSVKIRLLHVDGRNGCKLPPMKEQHCRSVRSAIRNNYCDETAYNHAIVAEERAIQ